MELFLTSSVHAVAHDIAKKVDLTQGNKLVFITTPAEPETGDLTWLQNDRQSLVDAGWAVTDYTITSKSADQIETDLTAYDYIYMSGGQTVYLLEQSQKSECIALIQKLVRKDGKIYIGTSAGSIICGPKLPGYFSEDAEKLVDQSCYNFVNFTLMPHWGSRDFKERYLGERFRLAYRGDQVPLVLLTDRQYVHVRDEQMNIVDVTNTVTA